MSKGLHEETERSLLGPEWLILRDKGQGLLP